MHMPSLKGRLILGAFLWTIGLFAATMLLFTHYLLQHPEAAPLVHIPFVRPHVGMILFVVVMLTGLWQVRRGLSPINQLRGRLSAVHDGQQPRVDGAFPSEVQPLVDDLNGLLTQREQTIARALAKAGDLAHGLKTPLAVLAQDAERARAAGQTELAQSIAEQVARMRRQVDYQLAQARAAGAATGTRSHVADATHGLIRALDRLHAERRIAIESSLEASHAVRAQREDLDEILGNLLDNACKWARSRVRVASTSGEDTVTIAVDDDGPGIEAALREAVLQRGVRADESAPGSGLGLAIARDLAELYGGSLVLERSPLGGLRAQLTLPAAARAKSE